MYWNEYTNEYNDRYESSAFDEGEKVFVPSIQKKATIVEVSDTDNSVLVDLGLYRHTDSHGRFIGWKAQDAPEKDHYYWWFSFNGVEKLKTNNKIKTKAEPIKKSIPKPKVIPDQLLFIWATPERVLTSTGKVSKKSGREKYYWGFAPEILGETYETGGPFNSRTDARLAAKAVARLKKFKFKEVS